MWTQISLAPQVPRLTQWEGVLRMKDNISNSLFKIKSLKPRNLEQVE